MNTLPDGDRQRLARLLGMLGSDHPGEVANAGRLADKLVRTAGLTWPQILDPPSNDRQPPNREPAPTWRATCRELAQRQGDLRRWERQFVADLPAFPRISVKQRCILDEIANRVLRERTA